MFEPNLFNAPCTADIPKTPINDVLPFDKKDIERGAIVVKFKVYSHTIFLSEDIFNCNPDGGTATK